MDTPRNISHSRRATLLSIRLGIGRKVFGTVGRLGVRTSRNRIVKGPCEVAELTALQYVARHTNVPVPKVYSVYHCPDGLYIELEYIRGLDLQRAWLGGYLSPAQKKQMVSEIAGYIGQLRRLEPPRKEILGSAGLEGGLDYRIGFFPFGLFQTHEEFHCFLRKNIPIEDSTKAFSQELFAHADLCPRNIIIDNGRVAALIDWEFGGWYSEYWEYTKAHYVQLNMPDWYEGLESSLTRYDEELKAERTL
ncbi:kinase-like protein [Aspergillus novoparasiticus]|uniref:Kinase-like protein n=1 Tax=Aspergillus novoparasiticus TaxID=986946 RepID=A0A5N6EDI6_9EURO|nr:kinase-like protein [Aspergillus novoparasiticus]